MKVALISGIDYDDYETSRFIPQYITEWTTVTDDEYRMLQKGLNHYKYRVIAQPEDQDEIIIRSVKAGLAMVEKEERERVKRAQEQAIKKEERLKKKLAKEAAQRKELYEKLKREMDEVARTLD